MILPRRQVLRWGFRIGTVVAWLGDPDRGYERRRHLLANADRVLGRTRAAPAIGMLIALNEGEPLPIGEDDDAEPPVDDEVPATSSEPADLQRPVRDQRSGGDRQRIGI